MDKNHMHDSVVEPSSEQRDEEFLSLKILQVIAENLRLLVLLPLGAGVIALGLSFFISPTYTATVKFLPPQQQQSAAASMLQSLGTLSGLAGAATGVKNPNDQFVAFLKTKAIQGELVDRFKLMERYDAKLKENARLELDSNSRVSSGKDNLITVEFDDKDPIFSAVVANSYVEELSKLLNRLAITEAQQRRVFFENQLTATKNSLIKAEQVLAASGIGAGALNATPAVAVENLARLRAMVTSQEVKAAAARNYLTESAPESRQIQAELQALRAQVSKAEKEQPAGVAGNEYIAKFRDFKYQETLFELFARQYEIAKVDESREGALIQVVDRATPPEKKAKPKRVIDALLVFLLTFLICAAWVFLSQILKGLGENNAAAARLHAIRLGFRNAVGLK